MKHFACHPTILACMDTNIIRNPIRFPYSSLPFLSLKIKKAGNFLPLAAAAKATVKPFFSALVVFIWIVF